jgi:putative methanogenesis marker protein 2
VVDVDLSELVKRIREYRGIIRKGPIAHVARKLIPIQMDDVLAAYGEDAAVIKCGREILLMAADGVIQDLIKRNPYWAGYSAVLVNVNDIAAMGGIPVALVDVIACGDESVREKIIEGMRDASDKFGAPIVGGHLHPDTSYQAIDVAILGKTDRSRLVLSSGASEKDPIIFASDLDGEFTEGIPYSWDTTSKKSKEIVRKQIRVMNKIAPYLTAGKDISNAGALGTLGMLLEASGKGATVDVSKIPVPKTPNVGLLQWLTCYQGCGFVVTCREARTQIVIEEFARVDITAAVVGEVEKRKVLELVLGGQREILFDFDVDSLGCALPQKT